MGSCVLKGQMSTPAGPAAALVAILLILIDNLIVISNGQIAFPESFTPLKLPEPERCGEEGFNYCGGDESKYPLDEIEAILNSTLELELSSNTKHRFFKSAETQQRQEIAEVDNSTESNNSVVNEDEDLVDDESEILEDLACEARKEIIPRFSRAKNVDNKWVYLAQIGHREFQ